MIIAICAALSAAATPLLHSAIPETTSAAAWVREARGYVSTCQNDVGFLVRLGRVLLAVGQPEEAAEHIERALLLSPEDPVALRAFATALHALGDSAAARQVMAMAPDTTPSVTFQTQWRDGWSVSTGAERNLLGVSNIGSLTLTLPGLDPAQPVLITLPLAPSSLPKGGGYWQAAATGQWVHRRMSGGAGGVQDDWTLQAGARTRQAPQLNEAGFNAVDAAAAHQRRYLLSPLGHHLSLFAAHLDSRTGVAFRQVGVGAGMDLYGTGCSARVGVEWVNRRYPANSILDGLQKVAQLQLNCASTIQLALRAGKDEALSPQRPGGDQSLTDLRIRGTAGRLAWEAEWSRALDARGYSPLLNSGAQRQQWRGALRIDYVAYERRSPSANTCPACRNLQIMVGMEANERRSNIELFRNNNLGLMVTAQWTK